MHCCCCSVAQSCLTLCNPMDCSTPGLLVHHQLPEFTQTHVHWVSDAIQPSHPLSSPSPPAPNPSQHQSLSNESALHMRWPKYWSFSFSIIPSKEHSGLISCRMDWLDLLAAQGTFRSLLQHHSKEWVSNICDFSKKSSEYLWCLAKIANNCCEQWRIFKEQKREIMKLLVWGRISLWFAIHCRIKWDYKKEDELFCSRQKDQQ